MFCFLSPDKINLGLVKNNGNPGGRGDQKTLPSVGGVWIFSGITHSQSMETRKTLSSLLKGHRHKIVGSDSCHCIGGREVQMTQWGGGGAVFVLN